MNARTIAVTAVSIAIVTVMVLVVRIPVPATAGYWHTGAIAEMFVAMAFGPIVGVVAAGVGAAIADLIGFPSFAPLTLIAHGSLGFLAGWLGWKKGWGGMLTGWIVGGLALVGIYFVGEAWVYRAGAANAAAEVVPNLSQVGLGIFGIVLFQLVKRAYPQIEQLAEGPTFTEE